MNLIEIKINDTLNDVVITLKEITDLLEVRHDKAMAKIDKMIAEIPNFGGVSKMDIPTLNPDGSKNKMIQTIAFSTKEQAIAVGARLNNILLWKLVQKLHTPKTQLELAKEQVALLERLEQVEQEKQYAIETKAWISNKKTATAMNTASQAVKKVNKLEVELDKSKSFCSIKRMEMLMHGQKFKWRELKSACKDLEIKPIDIFDANYGTVKAYPKEAWNEAYGIKLEEVA